MRNFFIGWHTVLLDDASDLLQQKNSQTNFDHQKIMHFMTSFWQPIPSTIQPSLFSHLTVRAVLLHITANPGVLSQFLLSLLTFVNISPSLDKIYQAPDWEKPLAYTHGISVISNQPVPYELPLCRHSQISYG